VGWTAAEHRGWGHWPMVEITGSMCPCTGWSLWTLSSIASIYFATQHNRFFSEQPTFFQENNILSNLWTALFFARYCITVSQVSWANLQSTSVKFLQDAVCRKSLKSVNIWSSYYKNKNVSFLGYGVGAMAANELNGILCDWLLGVQGEWSSGRVDCRGQLCISLV